MGLRKLKKKIKDKRNSDFFLWRHFFILKDSIWFNKIIQSVQYIINLPKSIFLYFLLFFKKQSKDKNEERKERVVAIVLSWKRCANLPLVVYGLKKQSFIDDIVIVHNKPSWLRVPGCKNIFNEENLGCVVRHQIAAEMNGYDYFVFSDDDLMLKQDCSEEVLSVMRKFGQESVIGFFGYELNIDEPKTAYTSGKYKFAYKNTVPIDLIKGRFHIISKKGIEEITNSNLDTPALMSEDDLRANIALQRKFKKPSYLIPIKHKISDLPAFFALENRKKHLSIRDEAIRDGLERGWGNIIK